MGNLEDLAGDRAVIVWTDGHISPRLTVRLGATPEKVDTFSFRQVGAWG